MHGKSYKKLTHEISPHLKSRPVLKTLDSSTHQSGGRPQTLTNLLEGYTYMYGRPYTQRYLLIHHTRLDKHYKDQSSHS